MPNEKLIATLLALGDAQAELSALAVTESLGWPVEQQVMLAQAMIRAQEGAWWATTIAVQRGVDVAAILREQPPGVVIPLHVVKP